MSVCSPCLKACNVPLCTAEIIIGSISSVSTDIKIIVENKTKGSKKIVTTQSNEAGAVTLVTAGLGLMADQSYDISVILSDATALCDTETLTIGTSTASCVTVLFENIKDSNNCQVEFESQTLTPLEESTQPGTTCLCITQEILDALEAGCCEPIPHTVAEMLALVGSFAPHAWYDITDAQSSFGVLRIRARDASNLEAKGTLIKGGRSFDVNYVLDDGSGNNTITYFRDDINNNAVTNVPGTVSITPIIPVDGSWYDNDFVDLPPPTIADIATVQIVNSSLKLTTLNLNSSTLSSLNGITAFGGTINTAGVSSSIDSIWMINGGILSCTDATIHSATLDNESALTVDGNGALSASAINLCTIKNQSTLIVIGVNGGNGTAITRCNISGHITVTIKGGETYQDKNISQAQSDFDGARVIAAGGAYDFVDSDLIPNYDRTFLGKVIITAAAPASITSFINRAAGFGHPVIFELGAGSSPITFVDNGTDIIMKGSANAPLTNEGDYVVFGYAGNVAKEIDRGIY